MPTPTSLCLMAVHAHPDDECFAGGIFGRYADEGARTVLVTCTLGEEGEIVDPTMDVEAVRPRLAEVRLGELRCSVAELGIERLHVLGYRDSGMVGTPANANLRAFTNTNFHAAVTQLVGLVRAERPQVMVTYDEQGGYGHPDHIMAHRIAVAAFEGAGDPVRFPVAPGEAGPWRPSKLYYIAWSRERMRALRQELAARGLPDPFDRPTDTDTNAAPDQSAPADGSEAATEPTFFQPESVITTMIDVSPYLERKLASFRCHRTQFSASSIAMGLPADLERQMFSEESFVLARTRVATTRPEDDLFAGVR